MATNFTLPGLRAARVARGLTKAELATSAGLSSDTIESLEIGRRNASPWTLHLLGEILNADPSTLANHPMEVGEATNEVATS